MSPAERIVAAVQDGDPELAALIANSTRVRELRAALIDLAALVPRPETGAEAVLSAVAARYGVDVDHITGESRRHEIVRARQVACYVLFLLGMSYSHTGRVLSRDHTTVMHAVSRVGENPRLRAVAQRIAAEHGWNRNAGEVAG